MPSFIMLIPDPGFVLNDPGVGAVLEGVELVRHVGRDHDDDDGEGGKEGSRKRED
jgi:hypothetical protein